MLFKENKGQDCSSMNSTNERASSVRQKDSMSTNKTSQHTQSSTRSSITISSRRDHGNVAVNRYFYRIFILKNLLINFKILIIVYSQNGDQAIVKVQPRVIQTKIIKQRASRPENTQLMFLIVCFLNQSTPSVSLGSAVCFSSKPVFVRC